MSYIPDNSPDSLTIDAYRPRIAITMGDPAGIGAEVIVKALADLEIRSLARFVIYGIEECLEAAADSAGIRPFWFRLSTSAPLRIDTGVVVVDYNQYPAGYWVHARPTAPGGEASLAFVDAAIDGMKSSLIDAIVTGPINKESWQLCGCRFPGHTEKLAKSFDVKRVTMAFVGGGMRVALASTHIGLFQLRNVFTIGLVFQPIDLLHEALQTWFNIEHPKLAVAGLNPHASENGAFGDEETRIITPAIEIARNHGIDVQGPFPADTLFTPHRRNRFDGIVAMYHDQGLIPMKMLAFDSAVNVTLGLPKPRTSVDHGTAFDIAGTGTANPTSMKEAIRLACRLAHHQHVEDQTPVLPKSCETS